MEPPDDITNAPGPPPGHTHHPLACSPNALTSLLQGWWLRTEPADQPNASSLHSATVCGPSMPSLCDALASPVANAQWVVDGRICVGMDALAHWCVTHWPPRRLTLIDGIAETIDAKAIGNAVDQGASPFDVECRAVADIRVGTEAMHIQAIDPNAIDRLTATLLREHVARCIGCGINTITNPPQDIMIRARSGSDVLLRPIETDVMSTAVDVGLGRNTSHPSRESIVFDRVTGAWHLG